MANEVSTPAGSAGELVMAEIVERMVIDAAYANAIMPGLIRVADITNEPTKTVEFPKWPKLTAAAVAEAIDLTNTAVNTTSVSITVGEGGLMVTVTDLLTGSQVLGGLAPYATQLGLALAELIDTDITADFASFTTSVGTTMVNITEADFLSAIYNLENAPVSRPYTCVLAPIQVSDLRTAIAASTGAVWGGSAAGATNIGELPALYGVPVWQSTTCPTANAAADRVGAMFPSGERSGLAMVLKRAANVEFERDASLRATEIVTTATYGTACVNTAANGGVKIVTDA